MYEHTPPTPDQTARSTRNERREGSVADRIWTETDSILSKRFGHARTPGTTPRETTDAAYKAQLDYLDESDTDDWTIHQLTANRLALVLLEMPTAGHAQHMLNAADAYEAERSEGYRSTLSDFNNDLAATLARLPGSMVESLPDQLLRRNNELIRGQWHAPSINNEDLYRALRGVKREVAFWRAQDNHLPEGWRMRQSTTEEDLHGADFVATDDEGRELRLDVKARTRYHETLVRLAREGWITPHEARQGAREGFVYKPNTDRTGQRDGTFTCIFDADNLGVINRYQYDNPARARRFIQERMADRHVTAARKIGRSAMGGHGSRLVYQSRSGVSRHVFRPAPVRV